MSEKSVINPMHLAMRCKAHSKRTGLPCKSPAVHGWSVCRMHGAKGGARSGPQNGNYRHGYRTKEAIARSKATRFLLQFSRKTIESID